MDICREIYFKLSQDEYLRIKDFVDDNIDNIEYAFAPVIDYFDLCKKCYSHYCCQCYYYYRKKILYIFPGNIHKEFHEKIIKSYFNIEYIKFFYLLQQSLVLRRVVKNICNVNTFIDIFMNLYYNGSIDCNKKKIKINYMIYIILFFLINSFIMI